jgi:hypothetical protein
MIVREDGTTVKKVTTDLNQPSIRGFVQMILPAKIDKDWCL